MKLHIITIGQPKLGYAKAGWEEYFSRLQRINSMRVTHLNDKYANSADKILEAAANSYTVVMEIEGRQYTSPELAEFLTKRKLESREVSIVIGGPNGLPGDVIKKADLQWSLSKLTLPHDLAMIVLLESLYRAGTINDGLPYHK
jgi:23S rRNA (pseudouridine1915-N3)-methyltransferase